LKKKSKIFERKDRKKGTEKIQKKGKEKIKKRGMGMKILSNTKYKLSF
jgi:hypothetical protein